MFNPFNLHVCIIAHIHTGIDSATSHNYIKTARTPVRLSGTKYTIRNHTLNSNVRFFALLMSFVYFSLQLTEVKYCLRFCPVSGIQTCIHAVSYRFMSSAWDTNHRLYEKSCLESNYVVQFLVLICLLLRSECAWCMRRLWCCCFEHITYVYW